jgi:transcriptional regulator with XRE-family HTH domain
MLTKTLSDGLEQYEIGSKLRILRLRKKMGLVELGTHAGLSPALLSKIERGRLFPTLPTLLRIALVFGVGLDHFFTHQDKSQPFLTRRNDRIRFPSDPADKRPMYHFESLDFSATDRPMSGYLVEFNAGTADEAQPHEHRGFELIYVIEGQLIVSQQAKDYTITQGDSLYLRGDLPHSYRRKGTRRCSAIVVTGG